MNRKAILVSLVNVLDFDYGKMGYGLMAVMDCRDLGLILTST